jgi:flagellar protein FlaI
VLKRFTTDPINVSKTMFTALDLVSVQTQTQVQGRKVRRNKMITEINSYDAENDEIGVQDVFQWRPEDDEFHRHADSQKLQEIAFERGWSAKRLDRELLERRAILSYLVTNGLNEYREVAATVQAYINDPETILTLMANGELAERLADLREMESVLIEVDPEKEALVPRPDPDEAVRAEAEAVLEAADERVLAEYRGRTAGSLADALAAGTRAEDLTLPTGVDRQMLAAVAGGGPPAAGTPNDPTRADADGPDAATGPERPNDPADATDATRPARGDGDD